MGKIPGKMMIIVNPASGGGKSLDMLPDIDKMVREIGVNPDIRISTSQINATDLAASAARCGYERVLAVGGDGTVNMVASGIAGSDTVLGIIPAGKGNDFFRMLEIPGDLNNIIKAAVKGDYIESDIGRLDDRLFFNMVGIGFDAMIARSVSGQNTNFGLMSYLTAIYRNLKNYPRNVLKLRVDSYEISEATLMVTVGIGRSFGRGFHLTPSARLDDGKFDVCLVKYASPMRIITILPRIIKGSHVRIPEVDIYRCRQLEIYSEKPLPVHYEGEAFTSDCEKISIKMSRDKLHVAAGVKLNK